MARADLLHVASASGIFHYVDQLEEAAVAYDGLPVSSGGAHGLGRISARESLSAWFGFLRMRTQASPVSC